MGLRDWALSRGFDFAATNYGDCFLGKRKQLPRVPQHQVADLGEPDVSGKPFAFEKSDTQFAFQRLDVRRHGCLATTQPRCRDCEVVGVRDDTERSYMV